MLLKFPKHLHKKLSVRLTVWYSGIFILSSLAFSIVSYLFVFSTVRDNREAIQATLSQYTAKAEEGGVKAIDASDPPAAQTEPAHLVLRPTRRPE